MSFRTVYKILGAIEKKEGLGVKIRRSIGNVPLKKFNPFLLFDHFEASEGSGFEPHPHLGHETITLVLNGAIAHEDFTGSKGVIYPGDLQFMTAGRGIVHTEMPVQTSDKLLTAGIQVWVDLPEHLKESKPRYRDLRSNEIPETVEQNGKLHIKIISGNYAGIGSLKDLAYTPIHYYHITMKPGASFKQKLPKDFNFFLYIIRGDNLVINNEYQVNEHDTCLFNRDGDEISCKNASSGNQNENEGASEFVLIGGKTLDQKVNRYGTFVATSQSRVRQGLEDYSHASNGFENLKTWKSSIGNDTSTNKAKES